MCCIALHGSELQDKDVVFEFVKSEYNVADILTKALPTLKHVICNAGMGVDSAVFYLKRMCGWVVYDILLDMWSDTGKTHTGAARAREANERYWAVTTSSWSTHGVRMLHSTVRGVYVQGGTPPRGAPVCYPWGP